MIDSLPRRATLVGLAAAALQVPFRSTGLPASAAKAKVTDFGAVGDGSVDDSAAIQAAIRAVPDGGTIVFPAGRYLLRSEVTISARARLRFVGESATVLGNGVRSYFNFLRSAHVEFSGLHFDTQQDKLATFASYSVGERQVAIRFLDGKDLKVTGCRFDNLYTSHILFKNSSDLLVSCCEFDSPVQNQDQYLTFVEVLSVGGKIQVQCNHFNGAETKRNDRSPCAVSASGITGELNILNNRAEHCGRNNAGNHRLAVFDVYADAINVTIAENLAINCREQFIRLSTTVGAEIRDNVVMIAPEADRTYSTLTVESGSFGNVRQPICRSISIHNNRLLDTARRQAFAIGILAYDWGAANEAIRASNNTIVGYDTALVISGPFSGIEIVGNRASDVNAFLSQSISIGGIYLTSDLGKENGARFEDLTIEENLVDIRAGSAVVPVTMSTHAPTQYKGTVGAFFFRRNTVRSPSPSTPFAVSAIHNSARGEGSVIAEENELAGYITPFYLRSVKRAVVRGNRVEQPARALTTDGSVQSLDLGDNQRLGNSSRLTIARSSEPSEEGPPLPCRCS